jgi:hypothetical protein
VENVHRALAGVLALLAGIVDAVLLGVAVADHWARGVLLRFGVAPQMQTAILIGLSILLLVAAVRLFGGIVRVLCVVALVLLAVELVVPLAAG